MPHLVAIAVAGAVLFAGYRWLSRETSRVKLAMQAAEEELRRRSAEAAAETAMSDGCANDADILTGAGTSAKMKELPKLELDPATGEYRVKH
jgi:hypothetical protein